MAKTITFTIEDNGTATLKIEGEKGSACRPIHDAISKDLSKILNIGEYSAEDTPEAREKPPVYTSIATSRAGR